MKKLFLLLILLSPISLFAQTRTTKVSVGCNNVSGLLNNTFNYIYVSDTGQLCSSTTATVTFPGTASNGAATILGTNTSQTVAALMFNKSGSNWIPVNATDVVNVAPWAGGTLVQGATTTMTATTSTLVVAGVSNQYLYIQSCHMSNNHASTDTLELLQNGSGGTALNGAGNQNPHGFGNNVIFPAPLKVGTLGNGLYVQNVTTGSSTVVDCEGFSSATSY